MNLKELKRILGNLEKQYGDNIDVLVNQEGIAMVVYKAPAKDTDGEPLHGEHISINSSDWAE